MGLYKLGTQAGQANAAENVLKILLSIQTVLRLKLDIVLPGKFVSAGWTLCLVGGGGVSQFLMLSPKLPKTKILYLLGGGGSGGDYIRHLVRIRGELKNLLFFFTRIVSIRTDRMHESLMRRLMTNCPSYLSCPQMVEYREFVMTAQ